VQCRSIRPAGYSGKSSQRTEAALEVMAPPGALPKGPEAMATTLPGNTVAMVAAAAGEEAGAEVEDPMEEDSYLVMCRFLLFFLPAFG
jgi:hypothetical protein